MSNVKFILIFIFILSPLTSSGGSITKIIDRNAGLEGIIRHNDILYITYFASDTSLILYNFNIKSKQWQVIYTMPKDMLLDYYYDDGTYDDSKDIRYGVFFDNKLYLRNSENGVLILDTNGKKISYNIYNKNKSIREFEIRNKNLYSFYQDSYIEIEDINQNKTMFSFDFFDLDSTKGFTNTLTDIIDFPDYYQGIINHLDTNRFNPNRNIEIVNYSKSTKKTVSHFFPKINGKNPLYNINQVLNDSSYLFADYSFDFKTFEKKASIYLTNDYGKSFNQVLNDSTWYKNANITCISFDGDSTLVAGCEQGIYFISIDLGQTWKKDSLPGSNSTTRYLWFRSIISTSKKEFYFIASDIFDKSCLYKLDLNDNTNVEEEINNNNISIYPNPSRETLNLKLNSEPEVNEEITITDIMGQQILTQKIDNILTQIDIKKLNTGIYFGKLRQNGTIFKFEVVR